MYAHDTNVYGTARDLNILNKDMTNVVNWMSDNKLTVNFERTNIVIFNKEKNKLKQVNYGSKNC